MTAEPLPPGELLNHGEPTRPRTAATVLLVRGAEQTLEVLLVQRNPGARFMGGAWVFPGGAVDPHEGEGDAAHRRAAVREVEEETGVRLPDAGALVLISRWVTPAAFRIRFDTYFFLAELPPSQEVRVDAAECVDFGWFHPADALRRHRAGDLKLVLPTIRHLELLGTMESATDAVESLRGRDVELVQPRIEGSGNHARVVVPSELEKRED
jgi:8-oxo-dGTP pyrophosphatase MutT (NUDIX family)